MEVKYQGRTFLVPAVPLTPILIYQRYGHYYFELQGWDISTGDSTRRIVKQTFYLSGEEGDALELEVKNIEQPIVSKLLNNKVKLKGSPPFSDKDYKEFLERFFTLDKLLRAEGLLQ